MKTQFGIVALLDALGARSASIETAEVYLHAFAHLQGTIRETFKLILPSTRQKRPDARLLAQLRPRFFGDSVLMTYAVRSPRKFNQYFARITFTLASLIAEALAEGVLFRGAIAIGRYIESKDVVLGPAVVDAANWYEQLDQIGIICTPSTTMYLKAEFIRIDGTTFNEERPASLLVLCDAPISRGGSIRSYLVNWPDFAADVQCSLESKPPLEWFYERLRMSQIPLGTESKHQNTETFFKEQIAYHDAQQKTEHQTNSCKRRPKTRA